MIAKLLYQFHRWRIQYQKTHLQSLTPIQIKIQILRNRILHLLHLHKVQMKLETTWREFQIKTSLTNKYNSLNNSRWDMLINHTMDNIQKDYNLDLLDSIIKKVIMALILISLIIKINNNFNNRTTICQKKLLINQCLLLQRSLCPNKDFNNNKKRA